jgi:hypothetical protein
MGNMLQVRDKDGKRKISLLKYFEDVFTIYSLACETITYATVDCNENMHLEQFNEHINLHLLENILRNDYPFSKNHCFILGVQ